MLPSAAVGRLVRNCALSLSTSPWTRSISAFDGQRFRLGAGFSDADRDHPPPVGAWVTYRFQGTHDGGLPRFASYLRVREDWPPLDQ